MTNTAYNIYKDILDYYSLNKEFPTLDYICNTFNRSKEEVFKYIKELELEGFLTKEGKNYVVKKNYRIPKKEITKDNKETKFSFTLIFKIAVFIIGAIATFMSVYFSFLWFVEFYDRTIAFLIAISIVGFSIIAFESIILFYYRKSWVALFLFSFLWGVVLILSMTSTIAGQVNKNFKNIVMKKDIQNDTNILLYNQLNIEIDSYKVDLDNKRKDREILNELLIRYKEDPPKYNSVFYRITLKDAEIKDSQKIISEKETELKDLLKNNSIDFNKNQDITFYQWLSEIIGIQPNVVEFFLGLFFALFLDIISPISFAIIIMLNKTNLII